MFGQLVSHSGEVVEHQYSCDGIHTTQCHQGHWDYFCRFAFNTGSTFSIFNFLTSLFKHLSDNMERCRTKKLEFAMIKAENKHGIGWVLVDFILLLDCAAVIERWEALPCLRGPLFPDCLQENGRAADAARWKEESAAQWRWAISCNFDALKASETRHTMQLPLKIKHFFPSLFWKNKITKPHRSADTSTC